MFSFILLACSALAAARVTPTAPGTGDSFAVGSPCTIMWDVDTSGAWTNVFIYLMTGSNNNMTRLTIVASGLDGTDDSLSPFQWTCPSVTPNAPIYFYQFTNGDDVEASTWTTRFAINTTSGESDSPPYDKQPDGDSIPWGEGRLASDAVSSGEARPEAPPSAEREAGGDTYPDPGLDNRAASTSSDELTTTNSGRHKSVKTSPGHGYDSSSYITTTRLPTHTSHRSGNHSSQAAHVAVPTASLPVKKATVYHMHYSSVTSAARSGSATPFSGVVDTGGMKLANSACINREFLSWTATLLSVAMLL